MLIIKLTTKEYEVMQVLWNNKKPMTMNDILSAIKNRTFKESSIFAIMKSLSKKGLVEIDHFEPSFSRPSAAYIAIIGVEQYLGSQFTDLKADIETDIVECVSYIVGDAKISKEDKKRLYKIFEQLHEDDGETGQE